MIVRRWQRAQLLLIVALAMFGLAAAATKRGGPPADLLLPPVADPVAVAALPLFVVDPAYIVPLTTRSASGLDGHSGTPSVWRRHVLLELRDAHNRPFNPFTHRLLPADAPASHRPAYMTSLSVTVGSQHRKGPDAAAVVYSPWRDVAGVTLWDRRDGTVAVTYPVPRSGRYRIALAWNGKPITRTGGGSDGTPVVQWPLVLPRVLSSDCAPANCIPGSTPPVSPATFDAAYGCDALYHSSADPQLARDFARWEARGTGIARADLVPTTTDSLQHTYRRHYAIVNQTLWSHGSDQGLAPGMVDPFLLELLRKVRVADSEFVVTYADAPMEWRGNSGGNARSPLRAVFGWCSTAQHHEMVALPTWDAMSFARGAKHDVFEYDRSGSVARSWRTKRDSLVWRGGDFGANGRRELVALARAHPEARIDAAFYYAYAHDPAVHGPLLPAIPFDEFFASRYVLNVDGAAAAYRLPYLFSGGSLVFWQHSPYYEHIYAHFQPWQHYVPVARDFSDLLGHLEWARTHDDQAQAIAARGQALARRLLTPENVFCYTHQALARYTRLLTFTPQVDPRMTRVVSDPPFVAEQSADCTCAPSSAEETTSVRTEL